MTGDLSLSFIQGQYLKSFSIRIRNGSPQPPTRCNSRLPYSAWSMSLALEVKKMAELLKSGATMLSQTCPECGTPLFRKGKETFCPKCNKPVVIIQSAEQETRFMADKVLEDSEMILFSKIREINLAMKNETDPEKLLVYGNSLASWLSTLEKLKRLRSQSSE